MYSVSSWRVKGTMYKCIGIGSSVPRSLTTHLPFRNVSLVLIPLFLPIQAAAARHF